MWIKTSIRKKANGKEYKSVYLTESYRDKKTGKSRHNHLANLSMLPDNAIEGLKMILKNPDFKTDSFLKEYAGSKSYGAIAFYILLMKKYGMLDALKCISAKSRKLIISEILCRLNCPQSKLSSVEWIKRTALPEILNFNAKKLNEDQIYHAMDQLHSNFEKVMKKFTKKNRENASFVLYDITSFYFTGKGPEIACNGYSRDKRPDCKQVIAALCLNQDGLPIFFDILPGNIQDKATVVPLIQLINERYGIGKFTFIGDRGMITTENVEWLKDNGYNYIIALTHKKAMRVLSMHENTKQLNLFDKKECIVLKKDKDKGIKYVICGSEYRKEHDLYLFKKILQKGRKALRSVREMVKKGNIKKYDKIIKRAQKKLTQSGADAFYDFELDENCNITIIENKERIKAHKRLCGYFILETTEMEMPAEEVRKRYKQLHIVEDAFKDLKNLVDIRPVYHYKYERVFSHFLICIFAQTMARIAKYKLIEMEWINNNRQYHTFMNILSDVKMGMFKIKKSNEFIITEPKQEQKEILKLFRFSKKKFMDYHNLVV